MRFIAILLIMFLPWLANAVEISIGSDIYDVTTVEGSWDALSEVLDDQVWWGDDLLAELLAKDTYSDFGSFVNNDFAPFVDDAGALFAWAGGEGFVTFGVFDPTSTWTTVSALDAYPWFADVHTWAVAELVAPVPEPASLALLSLSLAGLYVSRRKQSRS